MRTHTHNWFCDIVTYININRYERKLLCCDFFSKPLKIPLQKIIILVLILHFMCLKWKAFCAHLKPLSLSFANLCRTSILRHVYCHSNTNTATIGRNFPSTVWYPSTHFLNRLSSSGSQRQLEFISADWDRKEAGYILDMSYCKTWLLTLLMQNSILFWVRNP